LRARGARARVGEEFGADGVEFGEFEQFTGCVVVVAPAGHGEVPAAVVHFEFAAPRGAAGPPAVAYVAAADDVQSVAAR
jgi:hypothetical protein